MQVTDPLDSAVARLIGVVALVNFMVKVDMEERRELENAMVSNFSCLWQNVYRLQALSPGREFQELNC